LSTAVERRLGAETPSSTPLEATSLTRATAPASAAMTAGARMVYGGGTASISAELLEIAQAGG